MRLIDDTATKVDVWGLFNGTYNDASKFTEEETEFAKKILSDVQEAIDNQPTAFDLGEVAEQIRNVENYYDECGECIKTINCTACRLERAIEILKSAANATDEKIGGRGDGLL